MSDNNQTRVLIRRRARELSAEEVRQIAANGGNAITLLSVIITHNPNGTTDQHLDE